MDRGIDTALLQGIYNEVSGLVMNPCYVKDVGQQLDIPYDVVSEVAKRLESCGFIKTEGIGGFISLTNAGKAIIENLEN